MTSPTRHPEMRRAPSLRRRWNRGFALLTTVVLLSGLVGFVGNRMLVERFRDSAVRVERDTSTSAQLRADIVNHAVVFASPVTATQELAMVTFESRIRAGFTRAIKNETTPAALALLTSSRAGWEAIAAAAGPPDQPASLEARGLAVTTLAPGVLALLDEAGATSRAAVRDDLADATSLDRFAIATIAASQLLAILLAVRLARRLSVEVLRPVGNLVDSANHLAAGELNHRVVVEGTDELGELGASFNAMADAIASSQRSLTIEATTDALSGLANRSAFRVRLEAMLVRPQGRASRQAVLFVDLDDFKDVNDTLGHAAGDALLRAVASRLAGAVRPGDLVARFGGDEFALLLDDLEDPDLAVTIAERIVAALAEPVAIGDHLAHVGASVGLAMRHDDSTADGLMREADVAMYAAKAKGKHRVEHYDAATDDATIARHMLRSDVGFAVQGGQLFVEYQPVVDLDVGSLVGLEALVRWQHPTRGLLGPGSFIDLAEESGAIIGIGSWVLDTAAHQLHDWQRRFGLPELWISVNVSVRQLDAPGFADEVERILAATGLDPACLVLEVTESVLADPGGGAAATLATLRRPGVRVALDDFGTGHCSIAYLRQLPVDVIKIDRSFVAGTVAGGRSNDLLEAIVTMAHRLGLDVIPEGIEELDQLFRLRSMGCQIGQGFLLSRPVGPDAVAALLGAGGGAVPVCAGLVTAATAG